MFSFYPKEKFQRQNLIIYLWWVLPNLALINVGFISEATENTRLQMRQYSIVFFFVVRLAKPVFHGINISNAVWFSIRDINPNKAPHLQSPFTKLDLAIRSVPNTRINFSRDIPLTKLHVYISRGNNNPRKTLVP